MAKDQIKLGILIFPGFPMACLTSLIEPLRAANEISGQQHFAWQLLSEDGGKVTSSAEVGFDADCSLGDADGLDLLLLLSSPAESFSSSDTPSKLRAFARHGVTVGAVSGGVFPLVRSGAALQEKLSVHWCYDVAFKAAFPERAASGKIVEIGSRVISAAGAAGAFDLALHIVEQRLGTAIATEVACWFQHPMMRKDDVEQAVPILAREQAGTQLPPLVARAVEIATADLAHPVPVAEIAEKLGVSPRHVERSFKQATGQNPSSYLRQIRLQAARQIVMYSNQRLPDVAAAVGYATTKPFNRHYRALFGLTPAEDRKRINLYRTEGNLPVPSV